MSNAATIKSPSTGGKLRRIRTGELVKRSVLGFSGDDMATHAAALAYQVFFSLFPFVVFLLALLSFAGSPNFFNQLIGQAQVVLPAQTMGLVERVVGEIQGRAAGGLLSFGVIVALYTASAAMRAAMHAFDVAYGVEDRPFWKQYPLSIVYTVVFAALMISSVGLMLVGPQVAKGLAAHVGLGAVFVALWGWLHWPVAILLLTVVVALANYLFPNVRGPFRLVAPGAILSVLVWIAASLGFSYYMSSFGSGSYSAAYGSLGAIMVLLLYFFISAAVLLLGAELNATIYNQSIGKGEGDK